MRRRSFSAFSLQASGSQIDLQSAEGAQGKIEVLAHDVVRFYLRPPGQRQRLAKTWSLLNGRQDTPWQGLSRDELPGFARPAVKINKQTSGYEIVTESLNLEIHLEPFALKWKNRQGQVLAQDALPAYADNLAGKDIFHDLKAFPGERYLGFGEKSGQLDKAGRRLRFLNTDAMGYDAALSDPLYKHFPFYITYQESAQNGAGEAFGLFYDNYSTVTFDLDCELHTYRGRYRGYHAEDGELDYYFIYGPSIGEVIAKFLNLTGRTVLPPKWSLGYLGSTMKYTDAPNASEQLKEFVDLCARHKISCDMFHLSSGYTSIGSKRYVFNWNRDKVPDPQKMVAHFHQHGQKLSANIKPALLDDHPLYQDVAAQGLFVRTSSGEKPEVIPFWGGPGAFLDFTNPATIQWWKKQVTEQLLNYGIDSAWNDNNEFRSDDDEAQCQGFGSPINIGQVRPLQSMFMTRASVEAQIAQWPEMRPFSLSRSGCVGIQRYAQTWTGDNNTSWKSLRENIPMGLGMSLSGLFNWGHDIGGFAGPKPAPELFLRWVQNGIFQPRFCIHSWNDDGSVNEPWMYPEILPQVRAAIDYRYRLIPYLYSLFYRAHQLHEPIARPTFYDFAADRNTFTQNYDYMLGANLLVATVYESGARVRTVYLPQGPAAWWSVHEEKWYHSGSTVTVRGELEDMPLFVPAGGVLPLGPVTKHVGGKPETELTLQLHLHPQAVERKFTMHFDDGFSVAHARGERSELVIATRGTQELDLQWTHFGQFRPELRQITCQILGADCRELKVNGQVQAVSNGCFVRAEFSERGL